MSLRLQAQAWLDRGLPAIEVMIHDVAGSTPREVGARMLVSADGFLGTIGGGHLEWEAIALARRQLSAPERPDGPWRQRFALGPTLGQCCGGTLTLGFEELTHVTMARWSETRPRFHALLFGAGHVGTALVGLLEGLDCTVRWIDGRDDVFPARALKPHIHRLDTDTPEAEIAQAPPGAHYLVMTHDHDLDFRLAEAVLRGRGGDFAFLGLIGSRTKRARFLHRLEARGLAPDLLARLACPIGLPGIEGKAPEVIAIAVAAQLLALNPP